MLFVNEEVLEVRRHLPGGVAQILDGRNLYLVAPTGSGKTYDLIQSLIGWLTVGPFRPVLILEPNIHLVNQVFDRLLRILPELEVWRASAEVPPDHRDTKYWARGQVVISTPELVRNDLKRHVFPIRYFAAIFFDEGPYGMHDPKSLEGHAYCLIAQKASRYTIQRIAFGPIILDDRKREGRLPRHKELMRNLKLRHVYEVGEEELKGYQPPRVVEHMSVPYHAPMERATKLIEAMIGDTLRALVQLGLLSGKRRRKPYRELSAGYRAAERWLKQSVIAVISNEAELEITRAQDSGDPALLAHGKQAKMMISLYQILRVAWQLAVQHDPSVLREYLKAQVPLNREEWELNRSHRRHPGSSNWIRNFRGEPRSYRWLRYELDRLVGGLTEHSHSPLSHAIVELGWRHLAAGHRLLIFAGFVEAAVGLANVLNNRLAPYFGNRELARCLVGRQHRRFGMPRRVQEAVMADFRQGKLPILVATSLAEAGIDLDDYPIDAVVHLDEPSWSVPAANRDGRVGRKSPGWVYHFTVRHPLAQALSYLQRHSPPPAVVADAPPAELTFELKGRIRHSFFRDEEKAGGRSDPWSDELEQLFEVAPNPLDEDQLKQVPIICRLWTPGLSTSTSSEGRWRGWFYGYDRRGGPINCFVGQLNEDRYREYHDLPVGPVIIAGRLIRTRQGEIALAVDEHRNPTEYLVPCPEGNWYFADYRS